MNIVAACLCGFDTAEFLSSLRDKFHQRFIPILPQLHMVKNAVNFSNVRQCHYSTYQLVHSSTQPESFFAFPNNILTIWIRTKNTKLSSSRKMEIWSPGNYFLTVLPLLLHRGMMWCKRGSMTASCWHILKEKGYVHTSYL